MKTIDFSKTKKPKDSSKVKDYEINMKLNVLPRVGDVIWIGTEKDLDDEMLKIDRYPGEPFGRVSDIHLIYNMNGSLDHCIVLFDPQK